MFNRPFFFTSILFLILSQSIFGHSFNVLEYKIGNKGEHIQTKQINALINKVASSGGGTLFFPAGVYLTGPIELKSNITLYLDRGAFIKFTDDFDAYLPMVQSRWEGVRVKTFKSPIYAIDAENIAIAGYGELDGSGERWWKACLEPKNENLEKYEQIFIKENSELLSKNSYIQKKSKFFRPPMVMFYNCKNVDITGVSFTNPPFWTIVPTFCDDVVIDAITINNYGHSPNTDGIDPSSCRNVRISNSHITVGDDCIVIKSGRDDDGREVNRPTENITITNCTMLRGHGGVVIGSEMSGSVRRVTISNCVFEGTDRGIRLKTMRGRGGFIEDICVSNIVMSDISREGIMINMRYGASEEEPISDRTPTVRRISFSNIQMVNTKNAITIKGLPERDVEEVAFSDIKIGSSKGVVVENGKNIRFSTIEMSISSGMPMNFLDSKRISVSDLSILAMPKDTPAFRIDDCEYLRLVNGWQVSEIENYISVGENVTSLFVKDNILPGVSSLFDVDNNTFNVSNNSLKQQ